MQAIRKHSVSIILVLLLLACGTHGAYAASPLITPRRSDAAILFFQGLVGGLLAVFTPYLYTIFPFTSGYLTRNVKTITGKVKRVGGYVLSLIFIFTLLGCIISLIIKLTGVQKFAEHWIFNLFFFRIFLTLGISFLGAFSIKLPAALINAMASRASSNDFKGVFFMAFTLPAASFSSTFPIIGLLLVLAGKVPVVGPVIALAGFGIGIALPFAYPVLVTTFIRNKSVLNNIKVILGFFSLMLALKFLSNADISLELHLLDRPMFLIVWIGIWFIMGMYMLGLIRLSNDTESEVNVYGQEYTTLSRLFIAISAFVFAVYLLPGIWGAPLPAIRSFLPH